MTTKLTEQERYILLQKMTEAMANVTQAIDKINDRLSNTEIKLEVTQQDFNNSNQVLNTSVEELKKHLNTFREDTEHFRRYSNEINKILELKLTSFGEKFDNFNRSLELLEQKIESNSHAIQGLRQDDIYQINEKLNNIPTLENIINELTNDNSPLATKKELQSLAITVAEINGKLSTNFWGIIVTFISLLSGILLIYNRLPTPQQVPQVAPQQPLPAIPQQPSQQKNP